MKLFVEYIQDDNKALIKRLKRVKPVDPSPEFLKKSRAHLLSVLKSAEEKQERSVSIYLIFQRLIEALSKASSAVFLDNRVKSLIRERVRHFAALHELPEPSERVSWLVNWVNFLFGNRRAWALIVLAVFVAVVGIPFTIQNPALQMTYLRAEGKVIVERAGKEISVVDEIILQEGDKVKTEDSKAEIFFLDDSVSRLAPDTEVEITTLAMQPDSAFATSVEMNVTKGRVWSNVVNSATDSSSFTITASNVSGTVDKKATFDLSVAPNDVTVLAANNTVNLTVKQDGAFLQKVLAEGESLKLQGVTEDSSLLSVVNEEHSDPWIDENVQKDESYLVAMQDKYQDIIKEKAGVLPGSPFYGMKKFSESATVAFTFNEAEKEKKKLEIAERRLLEAEALLSSGRMDAGKALLSEFQMAVEGMTFEGADIDSEVADIMQNNLSEHIKGVAVEPLDSLLSEVKSSLEEVAVLVVSDAVKKLNFKLDMSLDTLFAAREFLKRNATQAEIFEHFRAYRALAEEVVAGIQALSSSDRNGIIASLLEHKIEELMVLRILEGVDAPDAFHKRISALKVNLLWDVNRILVSTGLETRWYQALRDQKNDEYTQKNLLRELKDMSDDEVIVAALERFERYYLSNLVIELVKKDQVITFEFAHLLLEDGEVTPNAGNL